MTTPPPAGRYPEPDDSEPTEDAAHPAEPERFELPTFETFETPPFESISSGSFETPPAPPPSPELTGEPQAPDVPEPPSAPEVAATSNQQDVFVPLDARQQPTEHDWPEPNAGARSSSYDNPSPDISAVSTPTVQPSDRRRHRSMRMWQIGAAAVVLILGVLLVYVLLSR